MSGSENDNYLDDEIDDFLVDGSDGAGASDSPRPAKRRRMGAGSSPAPRQETSRRKSTGYVSGTDSDSFIDDDDGNAFNDELSSPGQSSYYFADQESEAKSKYKVFVPKRNNNQDNIFVTQLTQPPSPPEMIRGPRWKKPDLNPPKISAPTQPEVTNGAGEGDGFDDDDGLDAAIAASLESFEEEQSRTGYSAPQGLPKPTATPSRGQKDNTVDATADMFDDIPDDAFDSDLSLSPPPATTRTNTGSFSQSATRPLGVRQTTLFDMAARSPANQPPVGEQVWSPPEKNEPPTQHKLENDALATWVYPTNLGKTRDYQFNITQRGLFHNLLVALPTGLGKTFIAATIMLNWFRWTKDAQIIFVAPTKPLVSQQISACFGIAGIPRSTTTMLTGDAAPGIRAEEWRDKRVFFMTPQTLINDLKSGIADPKRIVLLVVDEAHRATGGYAYVEVVKFLRRYTQSFRVLALTATPGSNVEAVQAVIDGLEISRVEIRTEQSLDIREYVHAKHIDVQTFENSDEIVMCMDLMTKTLQPLVDKLRNLNAYWGRDPMMLTAFGLTKSRQQWILSDAGRNANFGLKNMINSIFTVLASLAHGIDLLKYHGITPFYRHLLHFQSNTDGQKGGKYQRQIVQDDSFKKLMGHLQPWTTNPEFIGHPKLEYLKQVVLNHFMDAGEGEANQDPTKSSTRIMIFVHFRDSAEEVTRVLKRYGPMIRPHVFNGQASAKGSDGMNQKTQLDVVKKFKEGTYNTIVATSIGEEGLDIGEVDLIVCYDSSASPIRMLQRIGRTGRKRAGNIVLLLMQGKEEESYLKAKDNYEKMQQMIASGTRFTFHDDKSPRILPPDVRPVVDKRQIEIPEENATQDLPEPKRRKGRAPKKPPKKFHMPDNVETGFTKASHLAEGGSKRKPEGRRRARTPTPEPVDIPALEDVLLTAAQQRELEHRYCNIGGTSPEFIRYPRNDAFPRLQFVSRPTRSVKHGALTRRMIDVLRKMDKVGADCETRFKQVLDLETSRPKNDSVLPTRSDPKRKRRQSKANSGDLKQAPKQADLEAQNDHNAQPISPEQLLSSFTDPGPKPFYLSQKSEDEEDLDDFEPPDLNTLLSRSAERKTSQKRSKSVVDDESDY